MRHPTVCLVVLCLLGAHRVLRAEPGAAEQAEADRLFTTAVEEVRHHPTPSTCANLTRSQKLAPRPGTLFALARCEERLGRIASAVAHYRAYLASWPAGSETALGDEGEAGRVRAQHIRLAQGCIEALTPLLPMLTLRVSTTSPAPVSLSMDGEVLPRTIVGVPLPVDPGVHTLRASHPGGPSLTQEVKLDSGDRQILVLVVPPLLRTHAPAEARRAPEGKPTSRLRAAGFAAFAIGGAALALGTTTGILALRGRADRDEACPEILCEITAQRARSLGDTSTAGFVTAAASTMVGVTLVLVSRQRQRAAGSEQGGPR